MLFCTLTPEQRELYKSYLSSKDLAEIFEGHRTALAGIDILRKICNHPDLLERAKWEAAEVGREGWGGRCGVVVLCGKEVAALGSRGTSRWWRLAAGGVAWVWLAGAR